MKATLRKQQTSGPIRARAENLHNRTVEAYISFDAADVARILRIKQSKAYELLRSPVESGGIPTFRVGKLLRVRPADLDQWMAMGGTQQGTNWVTSTQ